jgi:Starter unit:ACP transacylase in aflatoxin biosynthesis
MDSVLPHAYAAVFLFGDQTGDYRDFLRKALKRKDFPLVESFLDQVSIALRDEISRLPRKYRERTPNFASISDLVGQHCYSKSLSPEIDSAITCIAHFAHFIW